MNLIWIILINSIFLPPWLTVADVELIFMKRLVLLELFTLLSIEPVVKEFKLSNSDKRSVFEDAIKESFCIKINKC